MSRPCVAKSAGNEVLNVIARDAIEIQPKIDMKNFSIVMQNVWYVSSISRNLFTVWQHRMNAKTANLDRLQQPPNSS